VGGWVAGSREVQGGSRVGDPVTTDTSVASVTERGSGAAEEIHKAANDFYKNRRYAHEPEPCPWSV